MADGGWKLRLFTPVQVLLTLALFAETIAILGVALAPAVALVGWASARLPLADTARALGLGIALVAGYFAFGLALLVVLPVARWLTLARGTPVGRFPYFSFGAWRWASYNALTLMLRFTFVRGPPARSASPRRPRASRPTPRPPPRSGCPKRRSRSRCAASPRESGTQPRAHLYVVPSAGGDSRRKTDET